MIQVSVRELLEAGAHFGHQSSRWNPKMKKFIFEERNGIHIIDLQKTVGQIKTAFQFLTSCIEKGQSILMVGTKKQAKELVKAAAQKCGVFWVTERWLGGTLTNLETIRKSVRRFNELEKIQEEGSASNISKKELSMISRELVKLRKNLEGIRQMDRLPGAIFVIDPNREKIAIQEAKKLGVPIVAMIDTNCDPDQIEYPMACNDDAIRTIGLLMNKIEQSIIEAKGMTKDVVLEEVVSAEGEKV